MLIEEISRMRQMMNLNEISSEKLHTYYSDIDQDVFNKIVKADPTQKPDGSVGSYTKWMLNLYKKGNLKLEDLYKATEYIGLYIKNKQHLKGVDMNKFKSLSELFNVIQPFIENPDEFKSNKEKYNEIKDGAEKLYEDEKWIVIHPKTKEASCLYGKGTQWCTAAEQSDNMFDYYNEEGKLYININKETGKKYQFHFESGQFMDENDIEIKTPIFILIGMTEGLVDFYHKIDEKHTDEYITRGFKLQREENGIRVYNHKNTEIIVNGDNIKKIFRNNQGKITDEIPYSNGVQNGWAITYNNGHLDMKTHFKDGRVDGEIIGYYGTEDKIAYTIDYVKGRKEGKLIHYNINGKIKEINHYKHDEKHGKSITYYDDGSIESEVNFKMGQEDGTYTTYYENGNINTVCSFKGGYKTGRENVYYPNGTLKHKFYYDKGQWEGEQITYDEKGEVFGSVTYEKGKLKR